MTDVGNFYLKIASEGEDLIFNGHTELTVERSCSGKHVIEVSVIRKAT